MQRSEGNEASFFLHSSLPKGVERRRRGGEEERAGDEKRTETVEENWEEKRHAYASREKERCNPLLSLSLVAIQFLRVSTREDVHPHGKTDPCSSPSLRNLAPACQLPSRIFFSTTTFLFPLN